MSWEWSHTNEAYQNAELNLSDLPLEQLRIIASEWFASEPQWIDDPELHGGGEWSTGFDVARYEARLAEIIEAEVPADILADYIWKKAEVQRSCDNGGGNCWVCPEGCHTVSFDRNTCKHCGNDFEPSNDGQEFCSRKCLKAEKQTEREMGK